MQFGVFRFFKQILKFEKTGDNSQIRNIDDSSLNISKIGKKLTRYFFFAKK